MSDVSTELFDHNGLNQITSRNGVSFSYDDAGNLTSSPDGSFSYDYNNKLTSVTRGGVVTTLEYDALSRLRKAGDAKFGYAGSEMIIERGANSAFKAFYVHGPGVDEPIARVEFNYFNNLSARYYITDHRGSIIGETEFGASAKVNAYDLYGRPDANNTGLYQYTGQV